MKSLFLRSSVALACALSLAACGGGGGNLLLSGSVLYLTKSGLQLQNNGGPALDIAAGQPSFTFPQLLRNDEDFNVTVKTQPQGAVCEVKDGKGRTGSFNIGSVVVTCTTDTHALTGTVSGPADGLVLVNGSDRRTINSDNSVTFAPVPDGSPYGVTVLTQPTGHTCTVTNGAGMMGSSDVTNVVVTCV
jgi:hypothetical protein